jgi:hypothetical protein
MARQARLGLEDLEDDGRVHGGAGQQKAKKAKKADAATQVAAAGPAEATAVAAVSALVLS